MGNIDTSQYEVQFPTADPVHFLLSFPTISFFFLSFFFLSFIFFLLLHLKQSSNKCRPFFLSFLFSVVFFSFFLLYTLPVLSDQTQIPLYPRPACVTGTGHRSEQSGNGTGTKRNQLKRPRNFTTLLVVAVGVGVGVLMGCDRIDIGFGYSPASRLQEFRCRYGYAFHVIFWSQNMDPNSYMDNVLRPPSTFQSPVSSIGGCTCRHIA
ncbi:hypothetical protein PEX1_009270 [Penicillium expansum]|uniref:Uncharacterized protein n=1 Tax=Penicillium expansum TaxID=27334 RepID=A0A0A2JGG0_PENEN|nr:hypothetical protein PEX2_024040 [Penicillium expansum]KGO43081.1 hypothetical protein PEXP_027990 [Penicillium expansum]KGO53876.1 hypothetical protein PEX2_024040 [Penicillium expansum]KGO64933.1 hypothetical protein PEX1_009270 [Penicillium expansum]